MYAGSMLSSYRDLGEHLVICLAVESNIIMFKYKEFLSRSVWLASSNGLPDNRKVTELMESVYYIICYVI